MARARRGCFNANYTIEGTFLPLFLSFSFFFCCCFVARWPRISLFEWKPKNVRVRGNKSAGETRGSADSVKLNIDIALSWTRIPKQDVWKFKTWLEQFVEQAANNNEGFMLTVLVHCSWQLHWELTRYFDKVYTTQLCEGKNIYSPSSIYRTIYLPIVQPTFWSRSGPPSSEFNVPSRC